jgi:hypothetical protein
VAASKSEDMKQAVAFLAVLFYCAAALHAQDVPKVEAFGGFSVLSVDGIQGLGWQANVAGNLTKNIGIVGGIGGHYKFHVSSYEYLFGPRFTKRTAKTSIFTHALFGAARLDSFQRGTNQFAIGLGGGLDINATERIAIRVFQIDWIPTRFEGSWQLQTGRASVGLVFKGGGGKSVAH